MMKYMSLTWHGMITILWSPYFGLPLCLINLLSGKPWTPMHCQNVPITLQCMKRPSFVSGITHRRTGTYGSQAVSSSLRTTATCCKSGIFQNGHGKTTRGKFYMVHRPDRCNLVVRTRTSTAWASSARRAAPLDPHLPC